jgi:hypothetical protein
MLKIDSRRKMFTREGAGGEWVRGTQGPYHHSESRLCRNLASAPRLAIGWSSGDDQRVHLLAAAPPGLPVDTPLIGDTVVLGRCDAAGASEDWLMAVEPFGVMHNIQLGEAAISLFAG